MIDSIVYCNVNQHKHEGYIIDLNNGNFENDFNATIVVTDIKKDYINNGYVYNDINDQLQKSTISLLSVVANIKPIVSIINQLISFTIFYKSNCLFPLLNN